MPVTGERRRPRLRSALPVKVARETVTLDQVRGVLRDGPAAP
jgi:hypothetical protein